MKQTLQLKLSQHLTLTPQLQQSIRLLQLSTVELNAEVERMLQENPLLEKLETEEDGTPTEFAGSAATAPGPVETRSATSEDQERVDGAERTPRSRRPRTGTTGRARGPATPARRRSPRSRRSSSSS
jgi:RNA polymerase sigma-54 factor